MKRLIFCFLLFGSNCLSAQQWGILSSGVTGGVLPGTHALTQYDSNLIAGGIFDSAGNLFTNNVAQWNGTSWDTIGFSSSPIGLWVYAECVYNDSLIIAGENGASFEMAEWNGTVWSGMNTSEYESIGMQEIYDFVVYQGSLYAGGVVGSDFNSISDIALWDGTNWDTLPSGVVKRNGDPIIDRMIVYNGNLYVCGDFDTAGNIPAKNIAMWNGSAWSAVGNGFNGVVGCLYVYKGTLYAGGSFDSSGSERVNNIAYWDGSKWNPLGSGIQGSGVNSIVNYGSILCVAGVFDSAGGQRTNNIAYWDGNNWNTMGKGVTGNSAAIFALSVYKGALIVAGAFDSAGGIPANNIAQWTSPLGISEIANKNVNVNVYPNPSNGEFIITLQNVNSASNAEVYNELGERVYSQSNSLSKTFQINLVGQPSGVYLYRIITNSGGLVGCGKIILEK